MVAEAEIMCQQSILVLDVKYHLCAMQEHAVKAGMSSIANAIPIFSQVRVLPESMES
ncbi:hypothetical protein HN873_047446, partial [Arachis hypogaea]